MPKMYSILQNCIKKRLFFKITNQINAFPIPLLFTVQLIYTVKPLLSDLGITDLVNLDFPPLKSVLSSITAVGLLRIAGNTALAAAQRLDYGLAAGDSMTLEAITTCGFLDTRLITVIVLYACF